MAVSTAISVSIEANESSANDLGTAIQRHLASLILSYASGTGDSQFDLVWSDSRSLVATTEDIDVAGALTKALGGTFTAVEIGLIYIRNKNTVAAERLIVGNGTNPVFSGLFGASTHTLKIPAGGFFLWVAPLDGGGMAVTATTADVLKFDSSAATVAYDILIIGRSA